MLKVTTVKGSADDGLPAIKPAASSQKVAIGAASAESAAIDAPMVRLVATSDCHVAIGLAPIALADGSCIFLPAGVPEYFVFDPGSALAVIQDSAAGTLYITPAV